MTSTPFNVGLSDNTRSSSRVLRPPGGGHTDIFGGDPEPPRGRRLVPSAAATATLGIEPASPTNGTEAPSAPAASQNGQDSPPPAPTPEPAPVETKQPSPVNFEPSKVDPPKRVRVPPGGFSSGLW